jgi:hypothetical protein
MARNTGLARADEMHAPGAVVHQPVERPPDAVVAGANVYSNAWRHRLASLTGSVTPYGVPGTLRAQASARTLARALFSAYVARVSASLAERLGRTPDFFGRFSVRFVFVIENLLE